MKKLLNNKIGRSIAVIVGGTAFAQLLNILLSPVITRIYPPEEYGVLTIYIALLSLFSLGAFKYEMAIPISKEDKIAVNVLVLSLLVLILYSVILLFVFMFFGNLLLNIIDATALYKYRILIPIGVFFTGLYKIFKQWNFRVKDYKTISKTTINQSSVSNVIKIIAGLIGFGPIGLIIGNIIGQSAGIRILSRPALKMVKSNSNHINFKQIRWNIKRYKDFPIYNMPTYLLITFGNQAPIIFLTLFYGSKVVGLFGLAYTIVKLPMNLIGNSVGDVFFAEAASIGRENPKQLKRLSNKLLNKLIIIGVFPLLTLLVAGPQLFSIVFGEHWYQAGEYARIIAVMLFFTLVFSPVSRVYEVFEKQKIRFYIDIFRVIMVILIFLISWNLGFSSYTSIILYSSVISITYFLIYIFAQNIINTAIKET